MSLFKNNYLNEVLCTTSKEKWNNPKILDFFEGESYFLNKGYQSKPEIELVNMWAPFNLCDV